MKKYLHVINIGIQNNLAYRFNYLTRTLFSFIPLFAMVSLWRTIYTHNPGAGDKSGFTQAGMIFYYLLVAVVDEEVIENHAGLGEAGLVAGAGVVRVNRPPKRHHGEERDEAEQRPREVVEPIREV